MRIARIAVLGAGTMGHGIAHAAIAGGYETRLYDVSESAVVKGRASIEEILRKGVELGKVTTGDADAMMRRLAATSSLGEALQDADFVIEAVPEQIDLKLALFAAVERSRRRPRLATNTSALSITEIAGREGPGARGGHALLQPRPQDEAGRDRAGARHHRRRSRRSPSSGARAWARRRCWSGSRRASSPRASTP